MKDCQPSNAGTVSRVARKGVNGGFLLISRVRLGCNVLRNNLIYHLERLGPPHGDGLVYDLRGRFFRCS